MNRGFLPEGEGLRRAVRWLDSERRSRGAVELVRMIEEAAQRFNLSPLEEQFLLEHFRGPIAAEESPHPH